MLIIPIQLPNQGSGVGLTLWPSADAIYSPIMILIIPLIINSEVVHDYNNCTIVSLQQCATGIICKFLHTIIS